jgi:zinc protease
MTEPRRWTAGVRREVLPNGLTLLVQRDDSAPVAAVVTHVRAGFLDEPDEWVGLSHVLEHMFFKGTPTRGVGAIARETKSLGGYLNASTSYDRTSYYVVVPARNLAQAVDVQADALRRATLDPAELARELRVIIEEARRKRDTASAVAAETAHELLFDVHRIRRWRIGQEDALARFTADDLRAYYASRYLPERTIVSVVAALPEEEMLAVARAAYGDWSARGGAVPDGPAEPPRRGVRVRTLRGDVTQGELVLAWRGVPPLDPAESPLEMAAGILATGRGSRLYRRLRETGIATSVGAWHYSQERVGVFAVHASGDPSRMDAMLGGIAGELSALGREPPAPAELERTRTLLTARWARQFESYEGKAAAFAAAEALGGVQLIDEEYARIGAVTGEEVRDAVRAHLDPASVAAVAYLPADRGSDLTPTAVEGAFPGRAEVRNDPVPAVRPAFTAPGGKRGREVAGVLHRPLDGADLLVRRRAGTPLVSIGCYFPRVRWETAADAGLGALTIRALLRGAGPYDAAGLALASERLGGTLAPVAGSDWSGVTVTALEEFAAEAAGLLRLVVTEPALRPDAVRVERDLLLDEARQQRDDMFRFPFQLALGQAYGHRTYGLPVGGTPESLPTLTADDAGRWHRENILGVRPAVIVVGGEAPERLADRLAPLLGMPGPAPAAPRRPAPVWSVTRGAAIEVVERDKRQTAFAMAFPGPRHDAPSRAAAEVWAAVASGLGGRLFEALRDRRSLAYTVLASALPRADGGALVTYIATMPEREEEARTAMLAELERFTREPPAAVELEQGRNYLAGQAEVSRQSAGALAAEVVEAWFAAGSLDELVGPEERYRRVTGAEVLEVARAALDPSRRGEGVVRGRAG